MIEIVMWALAIAWLLMGGVAFGNLAPELDRDTVAAGFLFCLILAPFALGAVLLFHPRADAAKAEGRKSDEVG